jgi:hypothetical protein
MSTAAQSNACARSRAFGKRQARLAAPPRRERLGCLACFGPHRRRGTGLGVRRQQRADDVDGAAGVVDVDDWPRAYSGAIFTAVCARLVVAPPISSGT